MGNCRHSIVYPRYLIFRFNERIWFSTVRSRHDNKSRQELLTQLKSDDPQCAYALSIISAKYSRSLTLTESYRLLEVLSINPLLHFDGRSDLYKSIVKFHEDGFFASYVDQTFSYDSNTPICFSSFLLNRPVSILSTLLCMGNDGSTDMLPLPIGSLFLSPFQRYYTNPSTSHLKSDLKSDSLPYNNINNTRMDPNRDKESWYTMYQVDMESWETGRYTEEKEKHKIIKNVNNKIKLSEPGRKLFPVIAMRILELIEDGMVLDDEVESSIRWMRYAPITHFFRGDTNRSVSRIIAKRIISMDIEKLQINLLDIIASIIYLPSTIHMNNLWSSLLIPMIRIQLKNIINEDINKYNLSNNRIQLLSKLSSMMMNASRYMLFSSISGYSRRYNTDVKMYVLAISRISHHMEFVLQEIIKELNQIPGSSLVCVIHMMSSICYSCMISGICLTENKEIIILCYTILSLFTTLIQKEGIIISDYNNQIIYIGNDTIVDIGYILYMLPQINEDKINEDKINEDKTPFLCYPDITQLWDIILPRIPSLSDVDRIFIISSFWKHADNNLLENKKFLEAFKIYLSQKYPSLQFSFLS